MEIRRTPGTQVSTRQLGYQQAAPVDYSPIANALSSVSETVFADLKKRQMDLEDFDLQRRLIQESNELQTEYDRLRGDPSVDPTQFSETIATEFERRGTSLVEEYHGRGYQPELLREFELRLGNLRGQFFAEAVTQQFSSLNTQASADLDSLEDQLGIGVTNDHTFYTTAVEQADTAYETLSFLTPEQRIQRAANVRVMLRQQGARSFALSKPEELIAALDPNGQWLQQVAPAVTGSAASVVATGVEPPTSRVMNYEAQASGYSVVPDHVQTLGQASEFAFEVNRANNRRMGRNGSSAMGVYQIVGQTMRSYAPRIFGENWEEQAYDFAAQDQIAEAIFNDHNGSASALRNQWVSLSLAEADRIRRLPWEQAREVIARGESSTSAEDLRAASASTVGAPPSTAEQTPASLYQVEEELGRVEVTDPLLRDLTGKERLDYLTLAHQQRTDNTAQQRAALEIVVENAKAEALTNGGNVAGAVPTDEELIQAYGPVAGPQVAADLRQTISVGQAIPTFSRLSQEGINARLDALKPRPGSPTYNSELASYSAAEDAAQRLLTERQTDPAAYVLRHFPAVGQAAARGQPEYIAAMRNALTTLGIDPATVPLMPEAAIAQQVQQYEMMTSGQRVAWVTEQYGTLGEDGFQAYIGNFENTSAGRDARIYALMRSYRASSVGAAQETIRQAIAGQEIIERDPSRKPIPTVLARYNTQMGAALRDLDPEASAAIQDVVAGLYVSYGGDPRLLDQDVYDRAFRTAIGGQEIADFSTGSVDAQTILPAGFTTQQFEEWKDNLTPERLHRVSTGNQTPVRGDGRTIVTHREIIDHGVFVMVSPGIYRIRMGDSSNGGFVMNTRGQPYQLELARRR